MNAWMRKHGKDDGAWSRNTSTRRRAVTSREPAVGIAAMLAVVVSVTGCSNHSSDWSKGAGYAYQGVPNADDVPMEPEPKLLPVTHFRSGQVHEMRGAPELALEQYRKAIALNHRFVAAYNRAGVVLDRLGRFDEANEVFLEAIALEPEEAYLRNNLAFSYMLQHQWLDAESELRTALNLSPRFTRARVNLGVTLGRLGRFDESLAQFKEVLPLANAYYNLGLLYKAQDLQAEALAAFEQALSIEPTLTVAQTQINAVTATQQAADDLIREEAEGRAAEEARAAAEAEAAAPPAPDVTVTDAEPADEIEMSAMALDQDESIAGQDDALASENASPMSVSDEAVGPGPDVMHLPLTLPEVIEPAEPEATATEVEPISPLSATTDAPVRDVEDQNFVEIDEAMQDEEPASRDADDAGTGVAVADPIGSDTEDVPAATVIHQTEIAAITDPVAEPIADVDSVTHAAESVTPREPLFTLEPMIEPATDRLVDAILEIENGLADAAEETRQSMGSIQEAVEAQRKEVAEQAAQRRQDAEIVADRAGSLLVVALARGEARDQLRAEIDENRRLGHLAWLALFDTVLRHPVPIPVPEVDASLVAEPAVDEAMPRDGLVGDATIDAEAVEDGLIEVEPKPETAVANEPVDVVSEPETPNTDEPESDAVSTDKEY
jgi:Flp pilus assembly protein TadD